jgi:chemotaxis protein methyltransferase CheR
MEITSEEKSELLALVNDRYGYDFSDYSDASMKRRINRFAGLFKLDNYFDLKHHLLNDQSLFATFIIEVTVNVTEMFRDPLFFKSLQKKVFPALSTYPYRKVWNAGCSTGEEVYSLAILLRENDLLNRTKIYATDINSNVIQRAKDGIYPLKLMKGYTTNYQKAGGNSDFSDYYTAQYDAAILNNNIKRNLIFSTHNLVSDKSFNEFNLIICRNVIIYFNQDLQEKVFNLFYESLGPLGFLALGSKESMMASKLKHKFEVVDKAEKIFRKIA